MPENSASDNRVGGSCRLCVGPRPAHFGSDRTCAFGAEGKFTPHNWNCGTINALPRHELPGCTGEDIHGDDESLEIIPRYRRNVEGELHLNGWIVLTRYKHRGTCSSAVCVGDFWPPDPLTLTDAEDTIQGHLAVQAATRS